MADKQLPARSGIEATLDGLNEAWDALAAANDACIAVAATGSKEYSRVGFHVLKRRAQAFVAAIEAVLEATGE